MPSWPPEDPLDRLELETYVSDGAKELAPDHPGMVMGPTGGLWAADMTELDRADLTAYMTGHVLPVWDFEADVLLPGPGEETCPCGPVRTTETGPDGTEVTSWDHGLVPGVVLAPGHEERREALRERRRAAREATGRRPGAPDGDA